MRDRNKVVIITALSVVLLVLIAFAASTRRMTPTVPQRGTQQSQVLPGTPTLPRTIPGMPTSPKATPNARKNITPYVTPNTTTKKFKTVKPVVTEAQKRADKINRQCLKIKGVRSASTIVVGDRALIGVTFDRTVKNINGLKKTIAKKVRSIDKSIKSCTVSNSIDVITKINKLVRDSAAGKNQKYIGTEMSKIIKDATPITR